MSLFTAIVTATVFALFGLPYKYYQCWFSFSWVETVTGTVMYLSLAGGVGGLLGWLGAYLAMPNPRRTWLSTVCFMAPPGPSHCGPSSELARRRPHPLRFSHQQSAPARRVRSAPLVRDSGQSLATSITATRCGSRHVALGTSAGTCA